MISLVNIIFEVGHGGNFLTHTLVTEYLNRISRKLNPELVDYTKENNEYLKTCFHPIIDRIHAHDISQTDYEKLRNNKCVVINSTPEVFNKIYNLGIWKNRYRKKSNLTGVIVDTSAEYSEYQNNINKVFPNKEYFEMDYQELFLDINKERIQEMLNYICLSDQETIDNVIKEIHKYSEANKCLSY